MGRLLLAVLVAGLLWPQSASGATLSMEGVMVVFTAAPGETNVLDVRLDGAAIVYTDTGAEITDFPSMFCTRRGPGTVACDPSGPAVLQLATRAELRDGNDRGTLDLPFLAWLDGGEGNDTVTVATTTPATAPVEGLGGPGDDVLAGGTGYVILRAGDGSDQLAAGVGGGQLQGDAGPDRLTGGDGREFMLGGGDADTILAGGGDDMVEEDASADGADRLGGGEGDDRVGGGTGNDRATGDAGDDTVSGDAGDDRLTGGANDDVLLGGEGDDRLAMGPGRDRADGGGDDDLVLGRDGVRATIECGTGEDAASPDARDRVHLDCETIEQPVRCRRRCRATGTLTTKRGIALGRGSVRVPARRTRWLRIPLSGKGAGAVRRAGKLDVLLRVTAGGRRTVTRFSLHTSL